MIDLGERLAQEFAALVRGPDEQIGLARAALALAVTHHQVARAPWHLDLRCDRGLLCWHA